VVQSCKSPFGGEGWIVSVDNLMKFPTGKEKEENSLSYKLRPNPIYSVSK
jgi:hypothetical protein